MPFIKNFNFRNYKIFKNKGKEEDLKWVEYTSEKNLVEKLRKIKEEIEQKYSSDEVCVLTLRGRGFSSYYGQHHEYILNAIGLNSPEYQKLQKERDKLINHQELENHTRYEKEIKDIEDRLEILKKDTFIFEGHNTRTFKGCERRVIVLLDYLEEEYDERLFYVALTRVTEKLYFFINREFIPKKIN